MSKYDNNDPDNNFFNDTDLVNFDTPYMFGQEVNSQLQELTLYENLCLLHLNVRSINANFETFKCLLEDSHYIFNVICLSETWATDKSFSDNSHFHLQDYKAIHHERKQAKRGGGLLIYIKENLNYKIREDLKISDCDGEFLCIEIVNKHSKNCIIASCYRPPKGNVKNFSTNLNKIFDKAKLENKAFFVLGDFNLNCLSYKENSDVSGFYNNIFQHGAVPLINKPTRVTTSTATLIDNILTNSYFEVSLKKGIIKTSISYHFPVFAAFNTSKIKKDISKKVEITKRCFSEENKRNFKYDLQQTEWDDSKRDANTMFENFSNTFTNLYEKHFPLKKIYIKNKDLMSPWMTKGMKKSSKQKQKLYIKYLKRKTEATENEYKNYKNLLKN